MKTNHLLISLSFMALFALCAAQFIPQQALWTDETTQLSGLQLNPLAVTIWLTGEDGERFGVPPDRGPPLSYWLGWAWSSVFGLTEYSLRWFGATLVMLAVGVLCWIAARVWGLMAAITCGLLFALSPAILIKAVEIRAYPLFILLTSICLAFFIFLLKDPRHPSRTALTGFTVSLILAMYTHFYGVILAWALLGSAFIMIWQSGNSLRPLLLSAIAVGFSFIGVIPFVVAALSVSSETDNTSLAGSLGHLGYRMFIQPPMEKEKWLLISGLGGAGLLCVTSLMMVYHNRIQQGLWLALGLGGIAIIAGKIALSSFDTMAVHYNAWMLPVFSLLFCAMPALAVTHRQYFLLYPLVLTAIVALVISYAFGNSELARHGDQYANSPHRQLVRLINSLGASNVAIIHEQPTEWAHLYFPLYYTYQAQIPQYLQVSAHGQLHRLQSMQPQLEELPLTVIQKPVVLVIRSQWRLGRMLNRPLPDNWLPAGSISHALQRAKWRLYSKIQFSAYISASAEIFKQPELPLSE